MIVKSVIPALILELEYEGDLLTFIGASKLSYDHQQRLRTIIISQIDTVYKWLEGEKYLYTYGSYLQYGFAWEGSVVQGIKIDSTATKTSVNGTVISTTYSTNRPQVSFFHTGDRLDSITTTRKVYQSFIRFRI